MGLGRIAKRSLNPSSCTRAPMTTRCSRRSPSWGSVLERAIPRLAVASARVSIFGKRRKATPKIRVLSPQGENAHSARVVRVVLRETVARRRTPDAGENQHRPLLASQGSQTFARHKRSGASRTSHTFTGLRSGEWGLSCTHLRDGALRESVAWVVSCTMRSGAKSRANRREVRASEWVVSTSVSVAAEVDRRRPARRTLAFPKRRARCTRASGDSHGSFANRQTKRESRWQSLRPSRGHRSGTERCIGASVRSREGASDHARFATFHEGASRS